MRWAGLLAACLLLGACDPREPPRTVLVREGEPLPGDLRPSDRVDILMRLDPGWANRCLDLGGTPDARKTVCYDVDR